MLDRLKEVWQYRDLIYAFVARDIKVRYRGSVLGFLWSFLDPLINAVVLWVIFTFLFTRGIPNFAVFLLVGILPRRLRNRFSLEYKWRKAWGGNVTIDERRQVARFLHGSGIEIGACHMPLPVDTRFCKVRYVDRLAADEIKARFPELKGRNIVPTDVICDVAKDRLRPFANESLDFIIACHLLEHLPDPLGFLKDCHRVLRKSGILFLAVPDKDYTFDKDRKVTPLFHIVRDFKKGVTEVEKKHLIDYLIHAAKAKIPTDPREREGLFRRELERSIHIHVWRWGDVVKLLDYLFLAENIAWELLEAYLPKGRGNEIILILKKTSLPSDLAKEYFEANLRVIVKREEALLKSTDLLKEEELKIEIERIRRENEELRAKLVGIYGSRAWKMVTILRKIKRSVPYIKTR